MIRETQAVIVFGGMIKKWSYETEERTYLYIFKYSLGETEEIRKGENQLFDRTNLQVQNGAGGEVLPYKL